MGPPLGSLCTASLVTFAESNLHHIHPIFIGTFLYVEVAWFRMWRDKTFGAPRVSGQALILWRIYSGKQSVRKTKQEACHHTGG